MTQTSEPVEKAAELAAVRGPRRAEFVDSPASEVRLDHLEQGPAKALQAEGRCFFAQLLFVCPSLFLVGAGMALFIFWLQSEAKKRQPCGFGCEEGRRLEAELKAMAVLFSKSPCAQAGGRAIAPPISFLQRITEDCFTALAFPKFSTGFSRLQSRGFPKLPMS